jgi:multiple sugar transport system substrate-binding protein
MSERRSSSSSRHSLRDYTAILASLLAFALELGSSRSEHREFGVSATAYRESAAVAPAQGQNQSGKPTPPSGPTIRVLGETNPALVAFEHVSSQYGSTLGLGIEVTKRDQRRLIDEIDAEFASGRSTYDLVVLSRRHVGKYVENGYVRPIDAYSRDPTLFEPRIFDPEKDLFPGWWREVSWYRGRPYGYPFLVRTMFLWYRGDLFDEDEGSAFYSRFGHVLTAPKTWRHFQDIAEFFQGYQPGLNGTIIQGKSELALWYQWLQYARTFGAKILDSPQGDQYGDIVVNSAEAVRATDFYTGLLRFSPPGAKNHNEDDALRAFQQGRVVLGIMWLDLARRIGNPRESAVAAGVGYAPVPSARGPQLTQLEGYTFLIPRDAPHPREAFKVMQWALSHEAQVAQTLTGAMSPRLSTYDDPRVRAFAHMRSLREFVTAVVSEPAIPEADQIADVMVLELSRIVAGKTKSKAGLDRIAVKLARLLEGKAKLRYPVSRP